MNGLQKVNTGFVRDNIFKVSGKKPRKVLPDFTIAVQNGGNWKEREKEGKKVK